MSGPVVERNAFKLFVTIDSAYIPTSDIMEEHKGYPIDNVIQIKLDANGFRLLFRDPGMSTSLSNRYDATGLLSRFRDFFGPGTPNAPLNNYNNFASDITTLINNTYNDIDVNPVALENACRTDGAIFNYWIKSNTQHRHNPSEDLEYGSSETLTTSEEDGEYNRTGSPNNPLQVYEVIARELDNMISRGVDNDGVSTSLEYQYSDLDALYTQSEEAFWNNSQAGDSIFIEGSFNVPTNKSKSNWKQNDIESGSQGTADYEVVGDANLPIIVQFVQSNVQTYKFQA